MWVKFVGDSRRNQGPKVVSVLNHYYMLPSWKTQGGVFKISTYFRAEN
jgi:hypothetical protein